MSGVRFVDPPASMHRRRPLIRPGMLAILGGVLAALLLLLLLGMLERGLGSALGDLLLSSLLANRG